MPDGQLPAFHAASYSSRWLGQSVAVRGTVSRVDLAKGEFPPYATIHPWTQNLPHHDGADVGERLASRRHRGFDYFAPFGPDTHSPATTLTYPARESAPREEGRGIAVQTGTETLVINGRSFATTWRSVWSEIDPLSVTKTWYCDEVPGRLVLEHQQTHIEVAGKSIRSIAEPIDAPVDDVTPELSAPPVPPRGGRAEHLPELVADGRRLRRP